MLNARSIAVQGIGFTALAVALIGFVPEVVPTPSAGGGGGEATQVRKKALSAKETRKLAWQVAREKERELFERLLRGEPEKPQLAVTIAPKPTLVDVAAQPKQKFNLGEELYGAKSLSAVETLLPAQTATLPLTPAPKALTVEIPSAVYAADILQKSIQVKQRIARAAAEEQDMQIAMLLAMVALED